MTTKLACTYPVAWPVVSDTNAPLQHASRKAFPVLKHSATLKVSKPSQKSVINLNEKVKKFVPSELQKYVK